MMKIIQAQQILTCIVMDTVSIIRQNFQIVLLPLQSQTQRRSDSNQRSLSEMQSHRKVKGAKLFISQGGRSNYRNPTRFWLKSAQRGEGIKILLQIIIIEASKSPIWLYLTNPNSLFPQVSHFSKLEIRIILYKRQLNSISQN